MSQSVKNQLDQIAIAFERQEVFNNRLEEEIGLFRNEMNDKINQLNDRINGMKTQLDGQNDEINEQNRKINEINNRINQQNNAIIASRNRIITRNDRMDACQIRKNGRLLETAKPVTIITEYNIA